VKPYDEALKIAQDKGYAEADPSSDVGGADAGAKIRLVSLLGFGKEITLDDIPLDSIENFKAPDQIKGAIKRISKVWKHDAGFDAKLELKDLSMNNFIAQAHAEEAHAIFYFDDGDSHGGFIRYIGKLFLMKFSIRKEQFKDIKIIENVTREAFLPMPYSNDTEADIISALRVSGDLSLSLVAEHAGEIIGQITFSPVTINAKHNHWFGLGPVAVNPDQQGLGVGSALIKKGLKDMKALGAKGCVLVGNPNYYGRFGFFSDLKLNYGKFDNQFVQQLPFGGGKMSGQIKYCDAFENAST